jgi:hypothetical protein
VCDGRRMQVATAARWGSRAVRGLGGITYSAVATTSDVTWSGAVHVSAAAVTGACTVRHTTHLVATQLR